MRKIGMLHPKGIIFEICYDEKAKHNPYRIYRKYWQSGWHKKLEEKYADLYSCTIWLNEYVKTHNEETR